MLSKRRNRPPYLLSKNLKIRLCHQKLGDLSNARVMEVSKLNDGVDIMIEKSQKELFPSDTEFDNKTKNLKSSLTNISLTCTITPISKIISANSHFVGQ